MKKWIAIVGINALILIIGIFFAVSYSKQLQEERTELTKDSFVSAVNSMEKVSVGHLETQQEYVNDWGDYINKGDFTLDEALQFLREVNSNEDVTIHIIDVETYEGVSTDANVLDEEDYSVSYKEWKDDSVRQKMKSIVSGVDSAKFLHVVGSFVNPLTGIQVVGFGKKITLLDEQGKEKAYLLLRLIALDTLQDQWIFPTGYEKAEVGLITSEGDYIIRSSAMKSENFLEFIRAYNDLTYPQKDALEAKMNENTSGTLEYKDARGRDAYWVYDTLGDETDDWKIIGYVPVDELDTHGTDWPLVLLTCCILGLLFVIDGAYFILMNRRLKKSMEEASEANQAKTRFLSSMSHDIRTPMNAIIGMTAIAMRNLNDTERVQDCLKKVTLASNHLLTLINDILDISRVESGRFTLNPMVFSLADAMTNLANIVRPQITAKNLDFRIHILHMEHEYLYADELRLNQIFINILSNAVKYTPTGGRITLKLAEQEVKDEEKLVRLVYTVADTGVGMEKKFIETMFEPFTRAQDSRIDVIEGSGLGLAITKQMVDAMHGIIEVESEPGKGSTFTVTLDLPAAEKMADDVMLPPMHMLAADDDPISLETVVEILKSLGAEVDTAADGDEAASMAILAHEHGRDYPVILLDWKMPGMYDLAAVRKIRAEIGQDVPIIILTAFDWSEIEEEARAAGVNGFINKPIFRSSIYTKISELLKISKKEEAPKEDKPEEFRGMHLLVAEDNEMNWEIISEILALSGITADRAENGAICVQKLTDSPDHTYAAVLMDVQMPVMKGDEAAREIRKSSIPYVRDIPIIAMTADAFAEDVRHCLEAGMNAHIAKPIDTKQLFMELKKVTGRI